MYRDAHIYEYVEIRHDHRYFIRKFDLCDRLTNIPQVISILT